MIHVPYKGSAPAITDLIGGHVPIMFDSAIAILPQIKAGKVRAIAITSAKRSAILPDVPTFDRGGTQGLRVLRLVRLLRAGQDARGRHRQARTPPPLRS